MNRTNLRQLGFELGERASGGLSQGAWFATTPEGAKVVLKWFPGERMADHYAALPPSLDELRAYAVPVPEYLHVSKFEGGILSAQGFLPGVSEDNPPLAVIDSIANCIFAKAGISGPPPTADQDDWGEYIVRTLLDGKKAGPSIR